MDRSRLEALLDRVESGDDEAMDTLLDLINRQSEGLRVLALEALKDGGSDTREQLLLTLADDPDLVIRPSARSAPLPADADMSDLHAIAQQAGAEWQARVGARQAPQSLLDALKSRERNERIQAARALGEYRDPESVSPLIDAIRSGDRQVAAAAVQSLQEIGESSVPGLVEALADRDEQVRWHAAKALSTVGNAGAVPALVRALEDSNYGTRWLAAEGLARIGRPAVVPLLQRLAEEKSSSWLRQGAWHVFNKLDLPQDEARQHYKQFGAELKRASAGTVATMAQRELKRLSDAS